MADQTQGPRGERGPPGHGFAKVKGQGLVYGCALAVAVFSYLVNHSAVKRIDRQSDRVALESVRNCIRANINSAVIKASAEASGDARSAKLADRLYPITDCLKTQRTAQTVVLRPAEVRKYVALVKNARAPIVRDGKVVGSRASILEGVKAVDQVGRVHGP